MMLYASSCERPSKSSASFFLPSSVSNSYSFSTGTQGRSSRLLLISSFRSACSPSSLASSSRAACHSSRFPILCSGISSPSVRSSDSRYGYHELDLPGSRNSSPQPHEAESARMTVDSTVQELVAGEASEAAGAVAHLNDEGATAALAVAAELLAERSADVLAANRADIDAADLDA